MSEVLIFRPEIGAESPLWDSTGSMVCLDSVGIPRALQEHLRSWAFNATMGDDESGLSNEGMRLLRQVEFYTSTAYSLRWDWQETLGDPFAGF
ncbi:MAG: hypothetical protein JWN95_3674 [Frankiales bacterium]|nr:hypothetical protein [Frankiales bacterium]